MNKIHLKHLELCLFFLINFVCLYQFNEFFENIERHEVFYFKKRRKVTLYSNTHLNSWQPCEDILFHKNNDRTNICVVLFLTVDKKQLIFEYKRNWSVSVLSVTSILSFLNWEDESYQRQLKILKFCHSIIICSVQRYDTTVKLSGRKYIRNRKKVLNKSEIMSQNWWNAHRGLMFEWTTFWYHKFQL